MFVLIFFAFVGFDRRLIAANVRQTGVNYSSIILFWEALHTYHKTFAASPPSVCILSAATGHPARWMAAAPTPPGTATLPQAAPTLDTSLH